MATTKKEAAVGVLGVARDIHTSLAGDEDADGWVLRLLWLCRDLDPRIDRFPVYDELLLNNGASESQETKLRRLIEHPATPGPERENAARHLDRIRGQRRA